MDNYFDDMMTFLLLFLTGTVVLGMLFVSHKKKDTCVTYKGETFPGGVIIKDGVYKIRNFRDNTSIYTDEVVVVKACE